MKQALATVIANDRIADGVYVLRLEEPDQARDVLPGQFVTLRCGDPSVPSFDPLLRRPLSVLRTGASPTNDLSKDHYDVLYDVVGRGTASFVGLRPGHIIDVLGPLGRPFEIERRTKNLLLVGGGVGIVPLVALAEMAVPRHLAISLIAGFRSSNKVFPSHLLPTSVEYAVSTDDGSMGHPGLVTDLLAERLDWADQVCACGPVPMLRRLAELEISKRVSTSIAMEEHMGCAVGVCLGCVVPTRRGNQRVCRDGPVFSLDDMGWGRQ